MLTKLVGCPYGERMKRTHVLPEAVEKAVVAAGSVDALAAIVGVRRPSIYSWTRIPPQYVRRIADATRLPLYVLAPDLFPAPTPRQPK